jgi:hypothetical protein
MFSSRESCTATTAIKQIYYHAAYFDRVARLSVCQAVINRYRWIALTVAVNDFFEHNNATTHNSQCRNRHCGPTSCCIHRIARDRLHGALHHHVRGTAVQHHHHSGYCQQSHSFAFLVTYSHIIVRTSKVIDAPSFD